MSSKALKSRFFRFDGIRIPPFASSRRIKQASFLDAICIQCRYSHDQKGFKVFSVSPRESMPKDSKVASEDATITATKPSEGRKYRPLRVPKDANGFRASSAAKEVQKNLKISSVEMTPFPAFQDKLSSATYEAITVKPFRHIQATPIQTAVLNLLPDLAAPHSENDSGRVDILARSARGTGKSLSFLVPAIEARQKAIAAHTAQELRDAGIITNKALTEKATRVYTRTRVGALILCHSREEATTIANEAILLSRNHSGMETRLFTSGMSKKIQLRDWIQGRRDIVVATPGRLRDLLAIESVLQEGLKYTQLLVIDQASQMLEDGFRDDIDAIIEYLPKPPERQTFIFTESMSHALLQTAGRLLDADHTVIDVGKERSAAKYRETPQFHTILPSAAHQLPHLMKLLAHDQITNLGKSKVIVFVPTTRMAQLFSTLVRVLRTSCLPAGDNTNVYEVHAMLSVVNRQTATQAFKNDTNGSSIMVTADIPLRSANITATRVVQLGIPSSDPQYFSRMRHTAGFGKYGRGDLVLLPWEMGYLTWRLMDVPLEPLTIKELDEQVKTCAQELTLSLESKKKIPPSTPRWSLSPLLPIMEGIEAEVTALLPRLDEESVRETFVSMLGYYIPKSGEVRAQRPVIVQGAKDWSVEACGLPRAPFISDAFLLRLGIADGRTKRFGRPETTYNRKRPAPGRPVWAGRGSAVKGRRIDGPSWTPDDGNLPLDRRDPEVSPETYRTNLYGRQSPAPTITSGGNLRSTPQSTHQTPLKDELLKQWGVPKDSGSSP